MSNIKIQNHLKTTNLYTRLWHQITPRRRKQLALLLVTAVLASFAEVLSIGAVLPFLGILMAPERLFESPLAQQVIFALGITEAKQLLLFTAAFVLAALFSGLMRLALLWAQARLGFAIGADLSIEIYKRTLYQPYPVHVAQNSSQVIAAISTKTNMVINYTLLPLLLAASSSLILVFILVALIVLNPMVALVVFGGFGTFYLLIALGTKKRLAIDSQRISQESNKVIKVLQEGLGGIRDVLIDGSQEAYCKIYRDADIRLRKSQANTQVIGGMPRYLIEALGMALIAILAYRLTEGAGGIANSIPILGALAIGAQRLLPVLQQIYSSWSNIRSSQSAFEDVLTLLEQPLPSKSEKIVNIPFQKSICLNQVGFRYSADAKLVLQNIDFEIPKGSRIGFMGTTGSGKSTLVDLIMGLLYPTQGTLTVDGMPITDQNYRAWQSHIAHVPQTIFLADSSIAENIAFGIPPEEINYEQVRNAAHQAQIAETIESWPNQYETFVGERGIRLSGGQRQRIGIARALYKKANVIVFDEATSALDQDTECAVMNAIESISNVTILIVAHRLSTLRNCDKLIQLESGNLKRSGSYEEFFS